MSEQDLPLCTGEELFWRSVAYQWVRQPGLMLVIVPEDLNTFAIGRWVRDYACQTGYGDPIVDEGLQPRRRETFVYDLSKGQNEAAPDPSALLPWVWSETQRGDEAERAAQGETAFYLMLTGLVAPQLTSLARWVRDVAQTWPAPRLAAEPSRFYCCCLVTAPRPDERGDLMEGARITIHPDIDRTELRQVITAAVRSYWVSTPGLEQEYLCFGIADMASGRRPHAEQALVAIQTEWNEGLVHQPDWYPQWRLSDIQYDLTLRRLAHAGLNLEWLSQYPSASENERTQRTICQRLWMYGLWVPTTGGNDLWSGLTALARAALHRNLGAWALPIVLPEATMEVLKRSLCLEHQMKSMLMYYRRSAMGRNRIRTMLDRHVDVSEESFREYIIGTVPREQQFPQPGVDEDDHVITICTLSILRDLFLDLLNNEQRSLLRTPLAELIRTRNRMAHLGWMTLQQYKDACVVIERVSILLARVRMMN